MIAKSQIIVDLRAPDSQGVFGISITEFARFAALVPDLVAKDRVSTKIIPSNDPSVKRILDALHSVGVDIFNSTAVIPRPFMNLRIREYESGDLDQCSYFTPNGKSYLGETTDNNEYDERGIPYLKAALRPYKKEFGQVVGCQGCPCLVVRGKVKQALEKSGLKGLQLVEPVTKGRKQLEPEEKVSVVWSDLALPPMKNLCFDNAGERFHYADRKSFPKGCMVFEGYFTRPTEIHYRREALAMLGDFDIALTAERFGGIGALQPYLIMSQRFRRFMKEELGLEMTGTPVRLDDDDTIPWGGPYPEPWEHLNKRPDWLKEFER